MIAQAEATGNQVLLKRTERLLLLLPKLVLTAPVLSPQASRSMPLGTSPRESANVAHRLQRSHSGAWIELLSEAKHIWPLARAAILRENVTDTDEILRKLTDRALSLVAQGEISRAVHLLQSTGVAEANDATADVLRPLLCPNPSQSAPVGPGYRNARTLLLAFLRAMSCELYAKLPKGAPAI